MARLVVTEPADSDLAAIILYLAGEAGVATAENYANKVDALYDRLVDFPGSGAPRPLLGPAVRIGLVPPFVVIYEYDRADDTVTVLRIVHGRRKITRDLLG